MLPRYFYFRKIMIHQGPGDASEIPSVGVFMGFDPDAGGGAEPTVYESDSDGEGMDAAVFARQEEEENEHVLSQAEIDLLKKGVPSHVQAVIDINNITLHQQEEQAKNLLAGKFDEHGIHSAAKEMEPYYGSARERGVASVLFGHLDPSKQLKAFRKTQPEKSARGRTMAVRRAEFEPLNKEEPFVQSSLLGMGVVAMKEAYEKRARIHHASVKTAKTTRNEGSRDYRRDQAQKQKKEARSMMFEDPHYNTNPKFLQNPLGFKPPRVGSKRAREN